ncbi:MAG: efflux RND transporter permease subunit [Planctomycetota bacterium]|jgi:HME family heavy-metal exporter
MLKQLIAFSVKNSALVLCLAGLLVFAAGYKLADMPVDIFPELNAPTVVIMAEVQGRTTEEVERDVTIPIESAVNGTPEARRVRSNSALGLSMVWVEFDWGVDIYRARQLVSERLALAEERLPEGVHCEIAPVTSLTGEIMLLSLSSPGGNVSDLELRSLGEYDLRNLLLSISGVSQVVAIGGEYPEYQINVKQDRLRLYHLSIQDVVEAAERAHSIASAGYLPNVNGEEIPIRQTGRITSVEDIKSVLVKYAHGAPVTIGAVADVVLAGAPKRGAASEKGKHAVVLSVQKVPGANTLSLTSAIDRALDEFESAMPKGMILNRFVMRQSDFIDIGIENVLAVARDAAILVTIILILFLLNVRTTIITLTAIPLSIAMAFILLGWAGLSINVMTLGGLAVAIGTLVDDAIIYVENAFRRLRENRRLPAESRWSHEAIIEDSSNEMRKPIVFATFIIIIVFVPLLFMGGLEGRFFRPMGFAYIVTVLGSLVVALTVTVAMCNLLLRGKLGSEKGDGFLVRFVKRVYHPVLVFALRKRVLVLAVAFALTVGSLFLAAGYGKDFLPKFNEGVFSVMVTAPPGTSLDESDRLARGLEKSLSLIEGVRNVVRRSGRAEGDEHAHPVSTSEIEVTVEPGFTREELTLRIREKIKDIPGITTSVTQPIEHRLSCILSGVSNDLAIKVTGKDLAVLRKIAKEIEAALRTIPGASDISAHREILTKAIPIYYRQHDLARWGLARADAAEQVSAAYKGKEVTEINQGIRRYKLIVRLAPEELNDVENLKNFLLLGQGGAHIRLSEVADVGYERSPYLITRENARRMAVVSCNVGKGHNLGHLVQAVQKKVDPIVHSYGYSVSYGGLFEAQRSASRTLYITGGLAILAIVFFLFMALGSLKAALLVMVNLPLALIGGIVALYITGSENVITNTLALFGIGGKFEAPTISIPGIVGFITVFGIATRNGILLVNHYNTLISERRLSIGSAIEKGSLERVIPILMTALTSGLGLFPIAIAAGRPGSELLAPLAIVGLGGLLTSTFLNLIIVPAGYVMFFRKDDPLKIMESSVEDLMQSSGNQTQPE